MSLHPIASMFPLFADVSDLPWVAIIAVGGGILLTIVIIVGGLLIAHHRHKQLHETARLAMEKGVPLPPAFEVETREAEPKPRARSSDIRSGMILIGVGAGLYLFFDGLGGATFAFVGAIPGFIGVALLLFGIFSAVLGPKDLPPRP